MQVRLCISPDAAHTSPALPVAETLLAVDDMIDAVIKALQQLGELDNTYMQVDGGMAAAACGDSSMHTALRSPGGSIRAPCRLS